MGKLIKLHNINKQDTPLFINGKGVNVPHNIDFPLADNFVELLTDANANFTIQGDVPDAECAGYDGDPVGAEAGPGGSDASAPEPTPEEAPVEAHADTGEAPADPESLTPPEGEQDEQPQPSEDDGA